MQHPFAHTESIGNARTCFRGNVFILTMGLAMIAGPTNAQQECGDQGKDNRANMCMVLVDKTWVRQWSKCTKLANGDFKYMHCSGSTKIVPMSQAGKGAHLCCMESRHCKGAFYVGTCLE